MTFTACQVCMHATAYTMHAGPTPCMPNMHALHGLPDPSPSRRRRRQGLQAALDDGQRACRCLNVIISFPSERPLPSAWRFRKGRWEHGWARSRFSSMIRFASVQRHSTASSTPHDVMARLLIRLDVRVHCEVRFGHAARCYGFCEHCAMSSDQ